MAQKVLIANRGEIACRIIRTCRRMGIGTIATYSSADRRALHVEMADEAVRIGAAPSAESYLDGTSVIAAALSCGAWAIHPGYGFLSEDAGFASACTDAGLVFIGPSAAAIRSMASKSRAKQIMAAAGLPVLAGDPSAEGDEELERAARRAGYPVMVKPALGGGGRGMRIVQAPEDLAEALAAARREASLSFGSDSLLIEKYLPAPRHVEVQVFGDGHGNIIHMYERDCSVQRRHQKVIEEAPAPGLDEDLRQQLGRTAVEAAKAVRYCGAGTVEFLLDDGGGFSFMEMNTRLQVEHPVTEMITGIDLVEWQLRVADGGRLPLRQEDIRICGHAIEGRLYAEDPGDGFRPGVGRIAHLFLPDKQAGVRVDTGVRKGDEITVHYDPMIAKIIAHGPDRDQAAARLSLALGSVRIAGPATNEMFLRSVVDHPEFRTGGVDTGFIGTHLATLTAPVDAPGIAIPQIAALALLSPRRRQNRSPWADRRGWRLGGSGRSKAAFVWRGDRHEFVRYASGKLYRSDGAVVTGEGRWISPNKFAGRLDGKEFTVVVVSHGVNLTIFLDDSRHDLIIDDPLSSRASSAADRSSLVARMPGVVTAVSVEAGDTVSARQPLLMIEAMKVEHTIRAPSGGRITEIRFRVGERVHEGVELIGFEPFEDDG